MVNLLPLLAPISYVAVLVGSLIVFSSLYRKRKAAKAASLEPWFPPHMTRDIYLSLLHLESSKPVPDTVLKAALLNRARDDIKRVMSLRGSKASLQMLLQRGSVGDDLWTRFTAAEAEMEEELRDVVMEANGFKEGWGAYIFQSANEMVNSEKLRERAKQIEAQAAPDRAWWDEKREKASRELLGEGGTTASSEEDAVLVEAVSKKAKGKK